MLAAMHSKKLSWAAAAGLSAVICTGSVMAVVEVAPAITLPSDTDGVVYVLDPAPGGPVLQHIQPHEVMTATRAGSNFLRAQVFMGPHLSAEVDGLHSGTVISSDKAIVYVRLTGESAEIDKQRVHLLWLREGKKRREITDLSMNIFGGQRTRHLDEVPCTISTVEGTNWVKIVPDEPLLPGEFAVAFLPKDVNQQPSAVFDFTVAGDPSKTSDKYAPPQSGSH